MKIIARNQYLQQLRNQKGQNTIMCKCKYLLLISK